MDARDRRAYRRLLALLPEPFRERFGSDMEELFAHRLSRARTRAGRAWTWVRAVADVVRAAALEGLRPEHRHEHREDWMGGRAQDLQDAVRSVARSPLFAATAVLTLALGIGASTATFSVVSTVLFKELPYREPDRLVALWPQENFNNAMLVESLASMPALEDAAGASGWALTLVGEGEPLQVATNRVTANHFRLLGVAPALGRDFADEEGLPGRNDVVILSHGFWMRVFGADPGVIGRTLALSGAGATTHTVIGIMPPDFRPVRGEPEVWVPMGYDPADGLEADRTWFVDNRIARLAPGVTLAQANEQMRGFARAMGERLPQRFSDDAVQAATVEPYHEHVAGDMSPVLWVTLAAVSLVLLMACANVANLLLARGETRRRDLSVRAALGAGRARVVRMLLAESAALGLLGGALGVGLAFALVRVMVSLAPEDFPRIAEVAVGGPVLLYAVAVTVVATLAAGLVPALRSSRVDATAALGGAPRAATGWRRSRLTLALVGAQVALAAVVTIGSGLMLRSLQRLTSVDTGLDTRGVLVLRASPPEGRYPDGEAFQGYYARVLEEVAALPDIASVGAIHLLPGTPDNWAYPTWPEDVEVPPGSTVPSANFRVVWPGYFETVGMRPLRGRLLQASDDADAEKVMLVNQAFADRFWPGLDPVGRTVRIAEDGAPFRVVGVVGDVRQHGLDAEARPEMYFASRQSGWNIGLWIIARVRGGEPTSHAEAVKEALWSVDPDVPVSGLSELSRVFDRTAATMRFLALVLSTFGALALLLGGVGVFGVTAYAVGRRVPEFGVRIALGSSRAGVLGSALLTCALPVGAGLVLGLAGAGVASRALESALFGIEPSDPATFAAVGATLLCVAVLASLLPAWRASRVDPVAVLSAD